MKILFLYSEVMGYNFACFKELVQSHNAELFVVRWDKKKLTPYIPPDYPHITYFNRSEFSYLKLLQLAEKVNPDMLFLSGWMDKDYLKVARAFKKNNIPVICGSDAVWKGTLKQWVSVLLSGYFFKRYFSHFFVPGIYQYNYAAKLGYPKEKILLGAYSCDVEYFGSDFYNYADTKQINYPRTLLFVGRFAEVKGLDLLFNAFKETLQEHKHEWTLELYGNGPLKKRFQEEASTIAQIKIHDFINPEHLKDIYGKAGAFCLPSRHEPWGLVIHEAVSAGLPIIASDIVGSATQFLQHNENGLLFTSDDKNSLKKVLLDLFQKSDSELFQMGSKSHILSQTITTKTWAQTLISILK